MAIHQLYRLFKLRDSGKTLPERLEVGLVDVIFGNGSLRVWLEGTSDSTGWPKECWLHHAVVSITSNGFYVWGTEFLLDGETEVVQEWHLISEGSKEVEDDE